MDRRRHAAARRNDPRLRAGHAPSLAAESGPGTPRPAPTARLGPTPTGCASHDRAALSLQPRRQEPAGDGSGGDPAALAVDPSHAGDALGGPRERLGLDYQFLRHADDTPGISLGQAARVRDPGDAQFPAARRARSDPLPGAAEGEFCNRGRRRAALRRLLHRDRVIRLDVDAYPGGGTVRDGRAHIDPRREFLRLDRPGFLPGRIWSPRRDHLPDQLLHHDLPRDLQQGAGFCRPV